MAAAIAAQWDVAVTEQKNIFAHFHAEPNLVDNSGVQDLFTMDVEGLVRVCVNLKVAVNALAAFAIQAKFRGTEDWVTLRSTSGQFVTPLGVLIDTSGDLTVLAVGSGYFILDCAGMSKLKIRANSGNAGGSSLALDAGGV